MKIKKVIINNFRAFKHEKFEFDDFNCIIGKNDSGKSTIIAALNWFFNDNIELNEEDFNVEGFDWSEDLLDYEDALGQVIKEEKYKRILTETTSLSVSVYFSEVKTFDINLIWDEFRDNDGYLCIKKTKDYPYTPYDYEDNDLREFPILSKHIQSYKNIITHNTYHIKYNKFENLSKPLSDFTNDELKAEYIKIGKKIDDFNWNDTLPIVIYRQIKKEIYDYYKDQGIKTKEDYKIIDDSFKYDHLNSLSFPKFELYQYDMSLEDLFNRAFDNDITQSIKQCKHSIANRLQKYLSKDKLQFHNDDIELNAFANDYLEFETKAFEIPNKINIPMTNRGEGLKMNIKNAVFRLLSEEQENCFFAFEEPETHLHPKAQIEMYKSIKKLSKNNQVLITTHSPYIVKKLAKDNIKPIVIKRDEIRNESKKSTLEERVLPYVSMNEMNYIAFDEPSIEYHIELFGYMQNKLNKKVKPLDDWIKTNCSSILTNGDLFDWYNTETLTIEPHKMTLPYCVRNNIDHPLVDDVNDANKHTAYENNKIFNDDLLIKRSIEIMREAILSHRSDFS